MEDGSSRGRGDGLRGWAAGRVENWSGASLPLPHPRLVPLAFSRPLPLRPCQVL